MAVSGCCFSPAVEGTAQCPAGQVACGDGGLDACRDVQQDSANCGSCGNACIEGHVCVAGVCGVVCPAPEIVCGGLCVDAPSCGQATSGGTTVGGSTTGGPTGSVTTGGSTTGASTGGSTAGGSTTGGSTLGSTAGGSTTAASTGASTAGGSTAGGSTTSGSSSSGSTGGSSGGGTSSAGTTGGVLCETTGSLLANGDFELGVQGFSNGYVLVMPPAKITPAGEYTVGPDPGTVSTWPDWMSFGDHTTGHGNMLIANGSTVWGTPAWSETVAVQAGAFYTFSFWAATVDDDCPPENFPELQAYANSAGVGNVLETPVAAGAWTQYSATWFSGAATTATLTIVDTDLQDFWNDFALDDISFFCGSPGGPAGGADAG
ncbi:MAG: carbohydrate binding domain-containing protein [Myxococcales bacterium]